MLHLIPAPLHRAGLRVAHAIRRKWWHWRKPKLSGCRVLALDVSGRVLLVRHSYGSPRWMPPGGGLARGEDPVAAAIRELREETGCRLDHARLLDLVQEKLHGAGNQVHLVVGWTADDPVADGREIIEAAFFAADALPQHMPPQLRERLPHWITAATVGHPPDAATGLSPPPAPKA